MSETREYVIRWAPNPHDFPTRLAFVRQERGRDEWIALANTVSIRNAATANEAVRALVAEWVGMGAEAAELRRTLYTAWEAWKAART